MKYEIRWPNIKINVTKVLVTRTIDKNSSKLKFSPLIQKNTHNINTHTCNPCTIGPHIGIHYNNPTCGKQSVIRNFLKCSTLSANTVWVLVNVKSSFRCILYWLESRFTITPSATFPYVVHHFLSVPTHHLSLRRFSSFDQSLHALEHLVVFRKQYTNNPSTQNDSTGCFSHMLNSDLTVGSQVAVHTDSIFRCVFTGNFKIWRFNLSKQNLIFFPLPVNICKLDVSAFDQFLSYKAVF